MLRNEKLPKRLADAVEEQFRRVMDEAGFNRNQVSAKTNMGRMDYKGCGFAPFTYRASVLLMSNGRTTSLSE